VTSIYGTGSKHCLLFVLKVLEDWY
jgi:hypothetical protein